MAVDTAGASTSAHAGPSLPADDDVQIAFLRSISLRRPIGPHKHFKMLAVVMDTQKALDTRFQRLSARLEKLSSAAPPSIATDKKAKPPTPSVGGTAPLRSRRSVVSAARKGSRSRSASVASSNPAEEDGDRTDEDADEEEERERQQETEETRLAIAALGLDRKVSPEMAWNELHKLFDLEALDEMEEGAIFDTSSQAGTSTDASGDSSSSDSTPRSSPAAKRKRSNSTQPASRSLSTEALSRYVFEHPGAPDFHSDRQRRSTSNQQSQNWIYGDDIRGTGDGMSKRDFYLWPWEDYEPIIAKRRLATNEEEEKGSAKSRQASAAPETATSEKKIKRSASPVIVSDSEEKEDDDGTKSDKAEEEEEDLSDPDSDADKSKDSTPKRRPNRRGQDASESKKKIKRGGARETIEVQSDDQEDQKVKAEDESEEEAGSDDDTEEADHVKTRRGSRKAPTPISRPSRSTPAGGRKSTSGNVTPTRSTRRSRRAGNDEAEATEDETAGEQNKGEASEDGGEEDEEEQEATESEAEGYSRFASSIWSTFTSGICSKDIVQETRCTFERRRRC